MAQRLGRRPCAGETQAPDQFCGDLGQHDPDGKPESLYWFSGNIYPDLPDPHRPGPQRQEITVSSERLTEDPGWVEVPPGQIIILHTRLLNG